jgi:hypothetical protein
VVDKIKNTTEIQTPEVEAIDHAMLTPLVQRALGKPTVQVIDWDMQPIHGGYGGGVHASAVYCLTGQGHDQDQTLPWSLILKTIFPGDESDFASPYYPLREAEAYRLGWLDDLPGDLAAPDCCGVVENPDGEIWVWLEQVIDNFGECWPLERCGLAARHLGQFNGAYLADRPIPNWSWFSADWLRRVVANSASVLAQLPDVLRHPLVCLFFPGNDSDRFLHLWAEREHQLDALDRLPRTISHMDAFTRNLFSKYTVNGDQTIAIDWAFVGHGAVGKELEPLVCRSLQVNEIDLTQAQELVEIVCEGYLDRLRDAGWRGDPRQVRLGFTSAVTLRFL